MKAVIDAVSLIFVLKVPELLGLVNSYVEKMYVTNEVYKEVFEGKFSEEISEIESRKTNFEIKNPKKILRANLGEGELSSISLAYEERFLFISEDRKAILFASSIGVNFTSLLSILIKAREDGKISKEDAKNILFGLVENGFYISSELLSFVLKELESD